MTYRGHIENGVVVLDEPAESPESEDLFLFQSKWGNATSP